MLLTRIVDLRMINVIPMTFVTLFDFIVVVMVIITQAHVQKIRDN